MEKGGNKEAWHSMRHRAVRRRKTEQETEDSTVVGGVPQCQHGRRCTRARKTGSGRGRARLHHHLVVCLQLLRLTLRTRRKRQQRQARCTPARLPVALEWGGGSLLEEEEEWLVPAGGNRGGSTRHHGGRRGRLRLWKPVWIGGKQARLEMSSVLLMTAAKTPVHHRT